MEVVLYLHANPFDGIVRFLQVGPLLVAGFPQDSPDQRCYSASTGAEDRGAAEAARTGNLHYRLIAEFAGNFYTV